MNVVFIVVYMKEQPFQEVVQDETVYLLILRLFLVDLCHLMQRLFSWLQEGDAGNGRTG